MYVASARRCVGNMSVGSAYYSLRSALAREAKSARLMGELSFGAPITADYAEADERINNMTNTELLLALDAHDTE